MEFERDCNQRKYTVNSTPKGHLMISKLILYVTILVFLILIAVAVGVTYLLTPSCSDAAPVALKTYKMNVEYFHLPKSIRPTHYMIRLIPSLQENNFTTTGDVTILLRVTDDTDTIMLNVDGIAVDKQSVTLTNLGNSEVINIYDQKYDNVSQIYTIILSHKLNQNHQYELVMKFVGKLNTKNQGFYRSHYKDSVTNATVWIASTQFSPIYARRAFPCFDEPDFKANFTLQLGRPYNLTTLSNMPKMNSNVMVEQKDWFWDHYLETPPMSLHLLAFAVTNFQAYRNSKNSASTFTIHARAELIEHTRLTMDRGPRMLNYLESYFDIKFPLEKIDLLAVPYLGYSATENWGLIMFRESSLLYEEKSTTTEDKRNIELTLGKELSHQWFGSLVTPKWWNTIWLKEGFATYFSYLAVQHVEPSWSIMNEFLISEIDQASTADAIKSSHPLSVEVDTIDQIREMSDVISYSKGAAIIRMLSHLIGEHDFRKGLTQYLKLFSYSNADMDDLWDVLTEKFPRVEGLQPNEALRTIMNTWTTQSGFPVVFASRNNQSNHIRISQSRFLFTNEDDDSMWWIPVSYASDMYPKFEDTKPDFWLRKEKQLTISIESERWYLLNLQKTGYYIVNYDTRNWKALIQFLMSFPPIVRVQLIGDAMDLAKANLLDYEVPLKMILTIGLRDKDLTYTPHFIAFKKLEYLRQMLFTTSAYGKFNDFVNRVFHFAFHSIRIDNNPNEYVPQMIKRMILSWHCRESDNECVNGAQKLYRDWMIAPNETLINANDRELIYCTAIRKGGESEWNWALREYYNTKHINNRIALLKCLGCTQIPWLLSKHLDMVNDTSIPTQDKVLIFTSMADNVIGRSLAFNYLHTHWKRLATQFEPEFKTLSTIILSFSKYMNTQFDLEQLQKFKNDNDLRSAKRSIDQAIEIVQGNINWMNRNYEAVNLRLHELLKYL